MGVAALFGAVSGVLLALAAGFFLCDFLSGLHQEREYKRILVEGGSKEGNRSANAPNGVNARVVAMMVEAQARQPKGHAPEKATKTSRKDAELGNLIRLAGLQDEIGPDAVRDVRKKLLLFGILGGAVMGAVFSPEMALILGLAGGCAFMQLPGHALKSLSARRTAEAERCLSEMLDVLVLCMRSGLSIDASIQTYCRHFDTTLSRDMDCARRKWSSGLERRDEALRKLASTYDSVVLGRVVDTIIRSVRYGSSMISNLESDSMDARSAYRAAREERIAKAPVKMMVPTGVFILPAMLIMVLGPVLLEFMGGGF